MTAVLDLESFKKEMEAALNTEKQKQTTRHGVVKLKEEKEDVPSNKNLLNERNFSSTTPMPPTKPSKKNKK